MFYPPPSASQQDFIARQYLHPTGSIIPSIASRGHRRSSSGSRERPMMGTWSSGGSSRASPYPSPSASPRPSYGPLPTSPLPDLSVPSIVRHSGLGLGMSGAMGGEMHHMGGAMGMAGMGMSGMAAGGMNAPGMGVGRTTGGMGGGPYTVTNGPLGMGVTLGDGVPIPVSKVNVTTPSTADASQKRRKQPANFACPVPGCGSTFTRHFNLKGEWLVVGSGVLICDYMLIALSFVTFVFAPFLPFLLCVGHLRSHAEEKPYQCKWPGCGKGFARQHDCKRHEQLHLNIRPYTCEGCKKPFARMDALNRHLRSEGGADCRKMQTEVSSADSGSESGVVNGSGKMQTSNGQSQGQGQNQNSHAGVGGGAMKTEPDAGNWGSDNSVVM
ncbi:hypothetical protein NLI96_g13026 [Meripilus lineatus]|uniref:C2H2-type domain-containing protein n=1 Tax=Meripilus lineatus TaxID=2056292 RepID=A0AAD5UNU5_9APHY|nr:hypothetical protein NLI96_g13026 [Physisporinus lineatus]